MMVLERLSARETPGWRGKPSGGGNEPAEVRQAGRQPASRGAECGWDLDPIRPDWPESPGLGKCTPGLDSSRSAELIQNWSFNRKEKGKTGWGRECCPLPMTTVWVFLWYIQPRTANSLHHILTSTYLRIKSATDVQMFTCFRSSPGESCLSPASLLPL